MSDIQRDREERQHVIKVLKNMLDWMEAANMISSKPERIEAVKYAIASIKTDLKYDLLYEETSGQADKPTTKNDLGVDKARSDSELIARGDVLNTIKETAQYHTGDSFNADRLIRYIKELPSVTPQEPILDQITEIIEPLRHLPIGEMSDIEWDILRVIDKYKAEVRDNNG